MLICLFSGSFGQHSKVALNSRYIKECLEGFSLGNTEYPQMETSQNEIENMMRNASRINFRTTVVNNAIYESHKHMKCNFQVCRECKNWRHGRQESKKKSVSVWFGLLPLQN